jgi:hypothetical protein
MLRSLLLLPSENRAMPDQIRVITVIENVGDHDLNILGPPGGDVMVDGTRYQHKDSVIMDGNITFESERCGSACHRFVRLDRGWRTSPC